MAILLLIILLWVLLQTTFFQNFLVGRITKNLSKNLNTTVSIKHVDFQLFDKMLLEGTLVLDQKKDTLLYAGAVKVSITDWFFFRDQIVLKYLGLEDATINLNRHDSVWNYQFLANYFSSPSKSTDTSSTPAINLDLKKVSLKNVKVWQQDEWKGINMLGSLRELSLDAKRIDIENKIIEINSIALNKPVFSQYDYKGRRPKRPPSNDPPPAIEEHEGLQWNPDGWKMNIKEITLKDGMVAVEKEGDGQPEPGLFDERHFILSDIQGSFKNFKLVDDSITARASISGKDRGNFIIKKLDADYKLTPAMMEFKNLDLVTNKSHLKNYFAMHYKSFNEDMQDFVHAVTLDGHFLDSKLSSDDIAYFAPATKSWNQDFLLNGTAHGKVDNMTAKNIVISAGENNYLEGNLSLRGLPEIDETFIDFRAKELRTSYNELAKIIPDLKGITTPQVSTLGNIKFEGSFTGYVRDFVTYGNLSTDIGDLKTDLHLQVPKIGKASYQGTLSTPNFQLGKFIDNNQLGMISFSGKVKGKGFDENDLDLGLDGTINKVFFNNYGYSNIIAHGDFKNKLFTGSASIDDPNIKIDTLVGSINFSKKNPLFNLEADVDNLNLKRLGFTKDSILLSGRFNLNFLGNNIDNFLGSAKLYDAVLIDNGQQLSFDSLSINSQIVNERKLLTVQTNELEASINGNFKILGLPEAFQLFLYKYYPAYINKPPAKTEIQDFTFMVQTKNISSYVKLFDKRISGFDNSVIIGNINVAQNTLNLQADVPQFNFSTISFNNIHLSGTGTEDTLTLTGEIDDVVINDSLHSPGTKLRIVAANDISYVNISASANKTLSAANLSARIETKMKGFKLTFNPSTFTINQKQWNIQKEGEIELHEKMLMAHNIKLSQNGQEIYMSTTPSEIGNSNDVILSVQKLIVEDFTPLFMKTPKVQGLLDGNIRINDPFGAMFVEFDTRLERFKFENDSVGVINANGEYLAKPGIIKLNAISNNELYNFVADFTMTKKDSLEQLNGSVVFKNSGIHILEEYLGGIFSNIYGRAEGTLNISGTTADPKLTGSISLDSASMKVDYTQCRYILADKSIITFNPDEIDFGTIKIKDTLNNTATLSGKIYHKFFDNFFFNELHLKTDAVGNRASRFLLLNTTARDNNQFYGKMIGRAELSLNGFITDMRMNISGEPTDSSHIYLPIGETAETGKVDYIEFIKFGREMKVDLKARENTNIKVDMELTANPLAKIDVILDETTGDVIKAQGSGKLNISAGTKDPLTIRGRYNVEEGEYTFDFQTFLKTPFTLQQGFIEWQGDPYLATLNVDAIYRAENVNLNNIPTSTGFSNAKGDVDIIFKLRGTLKEPRPTFEFQFPFDNPLKSDPIASEYLKTRYEADNNELNKQVTSLLLFNTFMGTDQSLISGNNTGNFVTKSVGQLLSATLSSSLNSWLQKLLNTNSVSLYTNINTADFNWQKEGTQREIQNVGNFGVKKTFLDNKLLVNVGGILDRRMGQAVTNSNSNFLFTPDVSFEYLITPDGRFRVIGFNRSDADPGDIAGVTRRNRTGIQLSYRKDFDTFAEFFTNDRRRRGARR
ncbi:MAG: translocation/assembly module TamB domain-containing protein [Ginsengibacter sp.]